jgi:repressor LexA
LLTGRQQEIWDFLVEYVDRHGYPPTVREIGEQVGLASPSTVHAHLANLERAGYLKRDPTKPRAVELLHSRHEATTSQSQPSPGIPLLGEIAAGGPLLAEQDVEEYVALPEQLIGGAADFLLRVKGDSMIDAGILVALAGDDESMDEATVKRYFREDGRIRLQPENESMEPIYAKHVQILGRVVGVFRSL